MSSTTTTNAQLPAPRVVRTGHTDDGTSVILSDATAVPFHPFGPTATAFTIFDTRATVPVRNTDAIPNFAAMLPRCPPAGAIFAISDYPGNGYTVPMHRTTSIDYAVVLSGEIGLVLDGGDETTVKAGEFIIQQGANHQWINRGQETCRVLFVMLGAEKVRLADGRELEQTVFGKPPPGAN